MERSPPFFLLRSLSPTIEDCVNRPLSQGKNLSSCMVKAKDPYNHCTWTVTPIGAPYYYHYTGPLPHNHFPSETLPSSLHHQGFRLHLR